MNMIATYLRKKEEILSVALQYKDIFESFNLDLNFSIAALEDERRTLAGRCVNIDGDRFAGCVNGLIKIGENILSKFQEETTYERADQLLTWLDNSGGSVVLYSSLGVRHG